MNARRENRPHRSSARLLTTFGSAAGFLLFSLIAALAQSAIRPAEPPPVHTAQNIHVNRTMPAFTPASVRQPISENPAEAEVWNLLLFPERIVPVEPATSRSVMGGLKNLLGKKSSPPTSQDNRHVVTTLRALQSSSAPYETTHLEAFIKAQ